MPGGSVTGKLWHIAPVPGISITPQAGANLVPTRNAVIPAQAGIQISSANQAVNG
jgi:hypothetical protein